MDALHDDYYTFMITSRLIFLMMNNVSDKGVDIHFTCNNLFFFRRSCRLWDNVEKYGRDRQVLNDNIIWRMRFACWVTKARETHSEYVTLTALPRQQWLRERVSMLQCTYIPVFLVIRIWTRLKHKELRSSIETAVLLLYVKLWTWA